LKKKQDLKRSALKIQYNDKGFYTSNSRSKLTCTLENKPSVLHRKHCRWIWKKQLPDYRREPEDQGGAVNEKISDIVSSGLFLDGYRCSRLQNQSNYNIIVN
jgi:hypothetical protein